MSEEEQAAWKLARPRGLRAVDAEAAIAFGAAWAALGWISASIDMGMLASAALSSFIMVLAALLIRRPGGVLLTAFAAGMLSIPGPSIAGPGVYKLWLLIASGLVFEVAWAIGRRDWKAAAAGGTLASAALPLLLLALSGEGSLAGAAVNLGLLGGFAGLGMAIFALIIWDSVAHSKWIIRYEVVGASRTWHAHHRRRLFNAAQT